MKQMTRTVRFLAMLAALAFTTPGALAQREPTVQKDLRERFGDWAEKFPAEMSSYSALETIEQVRWDKKGQQTGPVKAVFRYAFRRMGEKQEFTESRAAANDQSAAGNAKSSLVTANRVTSAFGSLSPDQFGKLPLMVTRVALRNHERMRYYFVPDETDTPGNFVIIGYRQIGGNGLMEVDRKEVFPSGRAWIDPEDGRLIRIEEEFGDKDTRYSIAIDNSLADKGWLPERITVRLFEKGRLVAQNTHTYTEIHKL